jgi:hypothetical protein
MITYNDACELIDRGGAVGEAKAFYRGREIPREGLHIERPNDA